MPTTVILDSDDEELVRQMVESGRYGSVAEVVRAALQRVALEDLSDSGDTAELKRIYDEGVASGMLDEDGETTLGRLEEEFRAPAPHRT